MKTKIISGGKVKILKPAKYFYDVEWRTNSGYPRRETFEYLRNARKFKANVLKDLRKD